MMLVLGQKGLEVVDRRTTASDDVRKDIDVNLFVGGQNYADVEGALQVTLVELS